MIKQTQLALLISAVLSAPTLAEEVYSFDEVVVSATRTNNQLDDVAASVSVITDTEIENDMVTGLDDLFKYTPGVTVETNARQGVQGINIRGIEGNRIKVLVDGVSQGNQFDSGGTFVNSSRVEVDTDLLKSVEVVKGAASSLQGSDAIGGIVAFETKDPADFLQGRDFGGHAKFNYSSADRTFSESVALANKVGELESLVAYTRRDGKELENFGSPEPLDSEANNLLVKLQYQLNQANRIEFSGNYIRNESTGPQTYENYSNASSNDTTKQYQLGIKHIWGGDLVFADAIEWQLSYLNKDESALTNRTVDPNNFPYNPGPIPIAQTKDYIYSDKGYQFDIQLDKFLSLGSTEHYIVYGMSYQDKDIKNINKERNNPGVDKEIFYMPSASESRYGLFVQDEITMGDWIITPGLRFDSFNTDPGDATANPSGNAQSDYTKFSDSAVTGRLGAIYKLNQEHRIFAQVSQGFRAPEFKELYYSFGNPNHGYINKPNPDLKAEESISYELGWRHNNDISQSEIAVFYSDYDNFIESKQVSGEMRNPMNPAIIQYVNVEEAVIKGIELSNRLSWDGFMPVEGFSSRVAAAYTEGKDGEGKPLNDVNPWNAVIGLNYDSINQWGTSLNLSYTAAKKKSDINTDESDILPISSATVVDLTAYYKPMEDLTLRAGVFNLTDEEYYSWNDVKGETVVDKDLTQASRNWAVTVKYDF
ncbi:TonB-dependent hemoglobin/transferrin/lactoferrin family receptor [Vibrio scophthalmi]|uniref:TonB-dependent hemoglobin/transferrin/lactoferrin family receptor n=1 Tax=Vibrio scophthalmi TaxID=45658 RepID=UPI0022835750|nr:TonB-dependent hemoglobin/transferrin/lactoferrin family receptor [Vibrio scophthalmi]MCY9802093.1 TonB-dependent hemoglobin/transferrin/lactoferrin family receptor [Vibrio scophthalmi]